TTISSLTGDRAMVARRYHSRLTQSGMDCRSTRHAWLILPLLAVFLLDTVPAAGAAPPTTTCQVFPADNVWNADISTLPVHARSAQWLASTAAASTNLHPDFG